MTIIDSAASDVDTGPESPIATTYSPSRPVNLRQTIGPLGRGPHDPTTVVRG